MPTNVYLAAAAAGKACIGSEVLIATGAHDFAHDFSEHWNKGLENAGTKGLAVEFSQFPLVAREKQGQMEQECPFHRYK